MLVDTTLPAGPTRMLPLVVEDEVLVVVDPAREGCTPRDGRLPTALAFPLTQLWQVERPGPRLELRAFGGGP